MLRRNHSGNAHPTMSKRILSGIQPSGKLHIGNYFGAMEPMLRLQHEGEAFYFIADLHALTSIHDSNTLRSHSHDVALDFLACGLDPKKVAFFRQSDVPEVCELYWILSTVTPMGLLERCHSFKDKTARGQAASHALFAYPVLMAADILLYDSTLVPVGKDQKQHLEVTRDIAQKINDQFGDNTLILPDPLITETTAVIPGIDGQKMSKSYGNTLPIFGEQKPLRKNIMRIPTDSTPVEDPKPTENSTILALYELFANTDDYNTMVNDFKKGGHGYGEFKQRLFDAYWQFFADARERRTHWQQNPDEVETILADGAKRARTTASHVLNRVRNAVGFPSR